MQSFKEGQRIRIASTVTRTAWGLPCNWAGQVGVITSFGGRVGRLRLWRVLLDGMESPFGGNDFAECVLEPMPDLPGTQGQLL